MDGDRRGDWEKGVDENLAMLNSAQRTTDKELDDLDLLDKVLRGDPEEGTDGLIARQHALENLHNELRAELGRIKQELFGDHAGGPGLTQRVDVLDGKRERLDKREGYFWHFVTAVAVQLLFLSAALVLNWERVEDFFRRRFRHEPPAHMETKKRGRPRRQKPIVMPETNDEPSTEEVP